MHGVIFTELQKYVKTKLGDEAWEQLLEAAGLGIKIYTAVQVYPDEEAVKLVTTAAEITGQPATAILEDFGEFIVPDLATLYAAYVKSEWGPLDFIEHTENIIHKVVRAKNPGAAPPRLQVTRESEKEVVIIYDSPRKMCSVAIGICRGVGKHYGKEFNVRERTCMHRGDDKCTISVKLP